MRIRRIDIDARHIECLERLILEAVLGGGEKTCLRKTFSLTLEYSGNEGDSVSWKQHGVF